ncbi:MAG: hypothetical protein ABJA74_10625, partial [Lapillicoccus sp.]
MAETDHALSPERAANLAENPSAGQGPVLLDIGGDIGAVVLHLSAEWEGAEVEFRAEGEDPAAGHHHDEDPHHHHHHHHQGEGQRPHVAVVGRPAGDGRVAYTAVFPELTAGRYVLTLPVDGPEPVVEVKGGAVT